MLPNHGYDDTGAREMQELVSSLRGRDIGEEHVERFRCLLGDCAGGRSPRQLPQWPQWMKYRNSLRGLYTVGDYNDDPARRHALRVPALIVTGAQTVSFHRAMNDRGSSNVRPPVVSRRGELWSRFRPRSERTSCGNRP